MQNHLNAAYIKIYQVSQWKVGQHNSRNERKAKTHQVSFILFFFLLLIIIFCKCSKLNNMRLSTFRDNSIDLRTG